MGEQREVLESLSDGGALAGMRWAYRAAVSRSLEQYNEADGHDSTFFGNLKYTLFRDRLDRVFSCERYAVSGSDSEAGQDLVLDQLSASDIATLPRLDADLVCRANLNGSPGWLYSGRRFLLASYEFGTIDKLSWTQKSPTKQRVARQRPIDPPQPTLFDELNAEDVAAVLTASSDELDVPTFVVAHSVDLLSGQAELFFGRPCLDTSLDWSWYWRENLLSTPPSSGGRRPNAAPTPTGPNDVKDAPVRLRRPAAERRNEPGSSA